MGDTVILITYADLDDEELATHVPRVVHVDAKNAILGQAPA